MLNYLWSRFTTAETQRDLVKVPPRPYFVQLRDGLRVMVCGAVANELETLKRDLQHKTDLAESYKGATERRDERIKELERQNNEYILQYAMQSDSVAVLEKQVSELSREREEFVQKYESARDAMREMKCLIHQHQRAFDSEYRRSFDEWESDPNLSPKGDKTDGDTAEYPSPVNAIADTTSHGE